MSMAEPMKLSDWIKRFTFYEILVGMKATMTVFVQPHRPNSR